MPKLAMWGAIAGGAKGYESHLEDKMEKEAAAADAAREERLAKMKMKHDESMAERREGHELDLEEVRQEGRENIVNIEGGLKTDLVNLQNEFIGGRDDKKFEHESSEGALDRESAERIAKIKEAGSSSKMNSVLKRYSVSMVKAGEANEYGITVEKDTAIITDPVAGSIYYPQGDKLFLWEGPDAKYEATRDANSRQEQALLDNPDKVDVFYKTFGYLPRSFLYALNTATLNAMRSGSE